MLDYPLRGESGDNWECCRCVAESNGRTRAHSPQLVVVLGENEFFDRLLCIWVLNSINDEYRYHREQTTEWQAYYGVLLPIPPSLEKYSISASADHGFRFRGAA